MKPSTPISPSGQATPPVTDKTKSAWDNNLDPHYGQAPQGQVILGTNSFAHLRQDMNKRRREMASRVDRALPDPPMPDRITHR
jgi:hypothetical protein